LLRMLARQGTTNQKNMLLGKDEVRFKFAPKEHVEFFGPYGWKPGEYRDTAREAKRLRRFEIPFMFKLIGTIMALSPKVRAKMKTFSGITALERA
jgi:hypothetical protein